MAKLTLGRAVPTIPLIGLRKASVFYAAALGVAITFENGDPPNYAVRKKNNPEFQLSRSVYRPQARVLA